MLSALARQTIFASPFPHFIPTLGQCNQTWRLTMNATPTPACLFNDTCDQEIPEEHNSCALYSSEKPVERKYR